MVFIKTFQMLVFYWIVIFVFFQASKGKKFYFVQKQKEYSTYIWVIYMHFITAYWLLFYLFIFGIDRKMNYLNSTLTYFSHYHLLFDFLKFGRLWCNIWFVLSDMRYENSLARE